MPSETSDIKQFLEIARRKDATCTVPHTFQVLQCALAFFGVSADTHNLYSGTDQEIHKDERDQIQDPLQPVPLHAQAQGLGQGRQAEAELTAWYVHGSPDRVSSLSHTQRGKENLFARNNKSAYVEVSTGLTVVDVGKKNKKPKKA